MNVLVIILIIINISLNIGINAHKSISRSNHRSDQRTDFESDYNYEDYSSKSMSNRYERQMDRLRREILLRDNYIARLERKIIKMQDYLDRFDQEQQDYDYGRKINNYALANSKGIYPHESGQDMSNEDMMDQIIPQVSARMPEASCMRSCNYLKQVRAARDPLSQYMYLMVCAEGCRKSISCLNENYCMPVMRENPDFFVQCVGKCELFKIAPKVFKSGKCK